MPRGACDRTSTKNKLQAKKERVLAAIAKASLPLNQLKPVPIPRFQTELAALKQAQFNLDVITREIENFESQLHFKDPYYSSVFESEKIQELADILRRELEASINLEKAIALRQINKEGSQYLKFYDCCLERLTKYFSNRKVVAN